MELAVNGRTRTQTLMELALSMAQDLFVYNRVALDAQREVFIIRSSSGGRTSE